MQNNFETQQTDTTNQTAEFTLYAADGEHSVHLAMSPLRCESAPKIAEIVAAYTVTSPAPIDSSPELPLN